MNIEIKDLDELIGSNKIKISDYTIDLNDMSVTTVIEVFGIVKNPELAREDYILEKIVSPLIQRQYVDVTLDELKNKLSQKQVIALWMKLLNRFITATKTTTTMMAK